MYLERYQAASVLGSRLVDKKSPGKETIQREIRSAGTTKDDDHEKHHQLRGGKRRQKRPVGESMRKTARHNCEGYLKPNVTSAGDPRRGREKYFQREYRGRGKHRRRKKKKGAKIQGKVVWKTSANWGYKGTFSFKCPFQRKKTRKRGKEKIQRQWEGSILICPPTRSTDTLSLGGGVILVKVGRYWPFPPGGESDCQQQSKAPQSKDRGASAKTAVKKERSATHLSQTKVRNNRKQGLSYVTKHGEAKTPPMWVKETRNDGPKKREA